MKQIAFVLFAVFVAYGQTIGPAQAPADSKSMNFPRSAADLPTQRVGPDDLLSVSVADCPELTRNFRVLGDGTLALPLLKERIPANNKLPSELEVEISDALVKEQLLVQPIVSVSVAEYRSLPVSVLGAVRHPITFQAAGEVTLLDALTRADGLSQEAGPEILISRPGVAQHGTAVLREGALIQRISVKQLIDEADPALNIRLHGGEEIRVPEAGRVYVIGNVKKTGAFPVAGGNDTTVLKMIALTEGLLPYTNKDAFIYRRDAGKESRSEIPVQLMRIMEHKAPDIPLQPNDILYIPDSRGKRLSAETVRTLAGFGVSAATGLLIWH
ncbi:MAG: polysaccharide biosynthesis/export family protein [Acidobacteriaceae bacterium]|nr:polysaccharide biosynthesis/export family protein [Acidobacteriaceae bacterium]